MENVKAKDISIWGKILVAVFVVSTAILKWTCVFHDVVADDVFKYAMAIYLPFSTIDLNLLFEKIFGKREESK